MQIVVALPNELAAVVVPEGRVTLEALGLLAYQEQRLSGRELQTMLEMESRFEVMAFLKLHLPNLGDQTIEEIETELTSLEQMCASGTARHAA